MIGIKVEINGLAALKANLSGQAKQVAFAASKALNAMGKGLAKRENDEIKRLFKNPVPRTENATKVFKAARKDDLEVVVGLDDGGGKNRMSARGFKGTIFPAKYLAAQIAGGTRVQKRFERALIKAGVMPEGMSAVFAKRSNALDQYGNLPASKIVQILAWFQAFPEQGYKMNMKDRSKQSMMKGKRKGMAHGVVYFRGGKAAGLPDGIWERHYPNGTAGKSFIRPILIYVRSATYQARFHFESIAREFVTANWQREFNQALRDALATAK